MAAPALAPGLDALRRAVLAEPRGRDRWPPVFDNVETDVHLVGRAAGRERTRRLITSLGTRNGRGRHASGGRCARRAPSRRRPHPRINQIDASVPTSAR